MVRKRRVENCRTDRVAGAVLSKHHLQIKTSAREKKLDKVETSGVQGMIGTTRGKGLASFSQGSFKP